jgi:hypothetical protein
MHRNALPTSQKNQSSLISFLLEENVKVQFLKNYDEDE